MKGEMERNKVDSCTHACLFSVGWNRLSTTAWWDPSHPWSPPKSMISRRAISLSNLASRNCHRAVPRCVSVSRAFSVGHVLTTEPIIRVEKTDVYRYGSVQRSEAIFKDLSWTVNPGESWAIVCASTAARGEIFQVKQCVL
jgi:hypothetical protein